MTTKIAFTLPAEAVEGASEAILLGDFNNWDPEKAPKLEKQSDGSFKAVAQLEEGQTYHYRFLLNDGRWVNDYNAQQYVNIPGFYVDNCVITVPVSEPKENKIAETSEATAPVKKVVKAKTEVKDKVEKAATPKKAAPKTKASATELTAKKTKAATNKKADNKEAEKPAKKAAPKEKK